MNRSRIIILSVLAAIIFTTLLAVNDLNQQLPAELVSDQTAPSSPDISARPLMTFSPRLPIEISAENRQNLLEGNVQEQKAIAYNQEVLKQSQIPWIELLAAFLVGTFLLTLRYGNTKAIKPEETTQQRIVRVRRESLKTLDVLQQEKSLPEGHYTLFYETVADTLRHYVDERYQLQMSSKTSQEFLQKIINPPIFDQEIEARLKNFFVKAELVKFAKQSPSLEECKNAELIAREVLKN